MIHLPEAVNILQKVLAFLVGILIGAFFLSMCYGLVQLALVMRRIRRPAHQLIVSVMLTVQKRKPTMIELPLIEASFTMDEEARVAMSPTTRGGRPAQVDGPPVWDAGDGTVVSAAPEAGHLGGVWLPVAPGVVDTFIDADANLDPDVADVIRQPFRLTVREAQAANLNVVVSIEPLQPQEPFTPVADGPTP